MDFNYWKLASELEAGRNRVLRMVASNEQLSLILKTLCEKAQIYDPQMLCSVLRLDPDKNTLHPIASISLPDSYCQALDGVAIGAGVGSCGTAAFIKKRVIVEDINTHPYWAQYKSLALDAGLQACWSEPIIGADGIVFGTFAIYHREPQKPTEDNLKFIELSANLAAVVFENNSNREKLLHANNLLNKTINERNLELEKVNTELGKVIEQQNIKYRLDITTEKMLTTSSLISGFSHEISTPAGNALTAMTAAEDKLIVLNEKLSSGNLTRKFFIKNNAELINLVTISKKSLLKVSDLLQRFNEVNTWTNIDSTSLFAIKDFFVEVRKAMRRLLGSHQLVIQSENLNLVANKEILWQIFFNLIENSIIHGFENITEGTIHINIVADEDELIINYQDSGCGISVEKTSKIFEPFYTSMRSKKSLGLGLCIISNLINHNLQGRIRLIDSPIGVRFEIILPNYIDLSS
ncbi:hybrid sensor histidine kinase/response regulator [Colwellia marinimaniae]|uniref:histidine kinase n=1 Tax=Colwellia marinimaniae TaxID=1513592 RepID=A0ABQ0MZC5_9GAMM|nr:hybrid sensor histidine kinase/response regulator [Colwellia marinimaniae]